MDRFSMNGRSTSASKSSGRPPERLAFSASSGRHAVAADDVLGELVAAERLLARVDRLVVAQHGDVHDVGADVDHRDVLVLAAARAAAARRAEGGLLRDRTRRPSPAPSAPPTRRPRRGPRPSPCAWRRSALPALPGWSATGPSTWKSRFTSSSANGMYWFASLSTWTSSSSSRRPAGTMIFLVITAPVGTAIATCLVRVPRRL